MALDFVHLHVHSEFSLLDGLSRIPELTSRAKELGMPALALTDHGAMYATIDFYRTCKKVGIKPVIGVEAYLAERRMTDRDPQIDSKRYHLLLLAQNQTGYRNLLKICTAAQIEGFYYRPRIDREFLAAHSEGLICTSGCTASEIPRLLERGREEEALRRLSWYRDVFGPERYFLELQEHDIPWLRQLNGRLEEFSRKFDLRLIATNDVHYVYPEQFQAHDVLLCIQTSSLVRQQDRLRMSDGSYHLRSPEEMAQLFGQVPDALKNTRLIAEMCEVDLDPKGYHLPAFDVPAGFTPETYLRHLVEEGIRRRYGPRADDPDVQARKEHELAIIHQMGFDTYFLIVWDLCRAAQERGIWWNVRGSGAGSIVAYAVGITNLDPLRHNLIFERFLNPGRISMPDIDLDFPDDRRAEMIEYTIQKYGHENVAQIITFGTMGARAAVRDVGRALDIPLSEVDRVARLIPAIPGKPITIQEALEQVPDLRALYESTDYLRNLLDTAMQLEGVARHASTHAAGVIISDRPLIEYLPLHRPTKGDDENGIGIVTQWDMNICEAMGLLKIDFLGLSTLTIMRRACELIKQRHGVEFDLNSIPIEDEKAFELLSRGDVSGLFQVEGQGMRRVLMNMRPRKFNHIVAAISLFRPGPMEYIDTYIRRMHGEEEVAYRHPRLEPILGETYGICVSGDAVVTDACTGRRYRLDEVGSVPNLMIQGVDESWQPAIGRVTRWIDSGQKPVYRVTLRNGAHIKITADHRLLTEEGWRPLEQLRAGDYVATPLRLFGPEASHGLTVDRRRLRVLAYLIADGSLTSMASADFVSKDPALLAEYQPYMLTAKAQMLCQGQDHPEIARAPFISEVNAASSLSYNALMRTYGIDRQHFYAGARQRERISARVVEPLAEALSLPETSRRLRVIWEEIIAIEPAGVEHVYDLTVAGLHNFVANNIVVHNCVYQEQIIRIASDLAGYSPGDADQIRKAVGKKIREKIDEHRTKFIKGAVGSGIPQEVSEGIYDDIEYFARYGFNKAHSAVYAIVTCQTAYLKANYPVEYMTALLTVERHSTEKIGFLVAECRRMGIEVLPPDVNFSQSDFVIEDRTNGDGLSCGPWPGTGAQGQRTSAIRFGLSAIKNVGEGPVQTILAARDQGGPFSSLEDFCQRVDLRQVNRRALECLIKVGALNAFGKRSQLLAVIDRMMGLSSQAHQARDVGQMTLFDLGSFGISNVSVLYPLPEVEEVSRREVLDWEKELVGVYVSAHPLQQLSIDLSDVVTAFCGQIGEEMAGQRVALAGMCADVRQITTKKGEPMAFVQLEDLQGSCEVVVFPRVYAAAKELLVPDKLILVRGKVDVRETKVSVLADEITDYIVRTRGEQPVPCAWPQDRLADRPGGAGERGSGEAGEQRGRGAEESPLQRPYTSAPMRLSTAQEHGENGAGWASPDEFISDLEDEEVSPRAGEPPSWPVGEAVRLAAPPPATETGGPPSTLCQPVLWPGTGAGLAAPKAIYIVLQRTPDLDHDKRRLRQVVECLQGFPGSDRFFIEVESQGAHYRLAFPNDTTRYCPELMGELGRLVGAQAVRVEELLVLAPPSRQEEGSAGG